MISEHDKAYVWTWLAGASRPVVAGVLEAHRGPDRAVMTFAYGQSYLARADGPALYLPELPKRAGRQQPAASLDAPGVIRDGAPDAWGQRVIMARLGATRSQDPGDVSLLTYLLESGSNRPGALDFQTSPTVYVARDHHATFEDLLIAADAIQAGEPVPANLEEALMAGSSAGGARPKATLRDQDRELIAKFSSLTDSYPVTKAEAVALNLGRRVGLDVVGSRLVSVGGRDVLLVDRFDRGRDGTRRPFVSALTILGLHEMAGRHATYHDLADVIRARFVRRAETLRELFGRIVFNVLVGNTDDHARNHAAFWDGDRLELTPAYDICPQSRAGGEQAQAMAIGTDGSRQSQLATCVAAAPTYELNARQARAIIDGQLAAINDQWADAADEAQMTRIERDALWGRQILNPYALYDYVPG